MLPFAWTLLLQEIINPNQKGEKCFPKLASNDIGYQSWISNLKLFNLILFIWERMWPISDPQIGVDLIQAVNLESAPLKTACSWTFTKKEQSIQKPEKSLIQNAIDKLFELLLRCSQRLNYSVLYSTLFHFMFAIYLEPAYFFLSLTVTVVTSNWTQWRNRTLKCTFLGTATTEFTT